jgi:hypothetical protein
MLALSQKQTSRRVYTTGTKSRHQPHGRHPERPLGTAISQRAAGAYKTLRTDNWRGDAQEQNLFAKGHTTFRFLHGRWRGDTGLNKQFIGLKYQARADQFGIISAGDF